MIGTEDKIFTACNNLGVKIRQYTVSEKISIIECTSDIVLFYRVHFPTDSSIEQIEELVNSMYYRTKGIK